jgi:hypothetical protein
VLLAACRGGGGADGSPVPGSLAPATALPPDPGGEAAGLVDFGRVEVGRHATAAVALANPGDLPVVIAPVEASGPFFADIPPAGLPVAAGGQASLELLFVPAAAGPAETLVVLRAGEATLSLRLRGEGVPAGPCRLGAEPAALDFGIVDPLVPAAGAVSIYDVGEGPCVLAAPAVEGEGFSPGPGLVEGVTLLPGGAPLPVAVRFVPEEQGSYQGMLRVAAGDASVEVPLAGRGAAPPVCIDWGNGTGSWTIPHPRCGGTAQADRPKNFCDRAVQLVGAELAEGEAAGIVLGEVPGLQVGAHDVLDPSGILAAVDASAVGPYGADGELRLAFAGCAPLDVPLHVDGYAGAVQQPATQPARADLDLLVVVDDGPAMASQAQKLTELAHAIAAAVFGMDLHLAVTTTSTIDGPGCPAADGRLLPVGGAGPRWLTSTTPDLAGELAARLRGGFCAPPGAGHGLEAAVRALTPPLSDAVDDPRHPEPNDGNAGFRRPGVPLRIMFLSAGEDASPDPAETYFQALRNLDGFRQAFAIAGPGGGCEGAEDGARYRYVVARSGGAWSSICGAWTVPNGSLMQVSGGLTRFPLDHAPLDVDGDGRIEGEDDALTVFVRETASPEFDGDGLRRWAYDDAAGPALVFEPAAVPPPWASVEIKYLAECLR